MQRLSLLRDSSKYFDNDWSVSMYNNIANEIYMVTIYMKYIWLRYARPDSKEALKIETKSWVTDN